MRTCLVALMSFVALAQASTRVSAIEARLVHASPADAKPAQANPTQAYPAQAGTAPTNDDAAVRVPLDNYLKGHATGDATFMRKAFLPTAHIEGVLQGKFLSWTVDEYCGRFTGKPADDEATRKRRIDRVDVVGTAAMARLTLVHGQTTLTDYFVLLKIDGEWKIANKVWTANPPR